MLPVIIFGPGYTASRLARRLVIRNIPVFALARRPEKLSALTVAGVAVVPLDGRNLPQKARLVYSIPPLPEADRAPLRNLVAALRPARLVYISSTSVYGNQTNITVASPVEV